MTSAVARLWPHKMLLLLLLALALGAAHPAAQAQGAWACGDLVADPDGVLGGDRAAVEEAAGNLLRLGAVVRVVVVRTTGQENLDLFVDDLITSCPAWQASDGGMKTNLVVLAVAVDERLTGLYYGEEWIDLFEPQQTRIQADVMNPHFRSGDYAGGLVAGLDEVARLVDLQLHPPTATPAPTRAPAVPPADLGRAIVTIVGVGAAFAVLAAAAIGAVLFYRARAARRRAQQRAREAKMKVADRVLRLPEEIAYAEAEVANLKGRVARDEYRDLPQKLAETHRLIDQANADAQNVELAGGDPDREGLTRQEYEGIAASFGELQAVLDRAGALLADVREQVQSLQKLSAQVPAAAEQARSAVEQARAQVAERTAEAPNRQAEQLLDQAASRIDEALAARKKKRPRRAMTLLGEAQPLLDQAVAVTGLLTPLRQRIPQIDQAVEKGATVFEQLAARYADASWQAIRGNGTEADNRVDWAQEALEAAAADLAADAPEAWATVPDRVKQAMAWLDEAAALVQSIRDQHRQLEEARQTAPLEARALQTDISQARAYIQRYDRDIREQLEHDLDKAEPDWGLVFKELAQDRPDYPGVLHLVKGVREVAERILAAARTEHETIERLVQRYTGEVRQAQAALSGADSYIRNHAGDAGRAAQGLVEQGEQSLRAAQARRSQADALEDTARRQALEEALKLVQRAGEQADSAAALARQDVRRAEEARHPPLLPSSGGLGSWGGGWGTPRPAPSGGWSSPGSAAPSPSRSSRSGGSSTSWGSTRSGGSSTSFRPAGPSRRGGGSTGW